MEPEPKKVSLLDWRSLAVIAVVLIGAFLWARTASPYALQMKRMARCQVVIDRESEQLYLDPRWKDVTLHASTIERLSVGGEVNTLEDAHQLWLVVEPWSHEVPMAWRVTPREWEYGYPEDEGYPAWWPPSDTFGSWGKP